MSLLTQWGYTITDADALASMLSAEDFNTLTASKYAGDARISPELAAACMGLRNYCGWHVYPAQICSFSERLLYGNGRIKRVGPDFIVQLPAAYVTGVTSITIGGEAWTDFSFEPNGLLRLFDVYDHKLTRKTEIVVTYTAGIPTELMDSIKELIAGRVSRALTMTNGVASESAGGVSVSYTQNWSSGGGAGALQSTDVETLEPYKLRGVF